MYVEVHRSPATISLITGSAIASAMTTSSSQQQYSSFPVKYDAEGRSIPTIPDYRGCSFCQSKLHFRKHCLFNPKRIAPEKMPATVPVPTNIHSERRGFYSIYQYREDDLGTIGYGHAQIDTGADIDFMSYQTCCRLRLQDRLTNTGGLGCSLQQAGRYYGRLQNIRLFLGTEEEIVFISPVVQDHPDVSIIIGYPTCESERWILYPYANKINGPDKLYITTYPSVATVNKQLKNLFDAAEVRAKPIVDRQQTFDSDLPSETSQYSIPLYTYNVDEMTPTDDNSSIPFQQVSHLVSLFPELQQISTDEHHNSNPTPAMPTSININDVFMEEVDVTMRNQEISLNPSNWFHPPPTESCIAPLNINMSAPTDSATTRPHQQGTSISGTYHYWDSSIPSPDSTELRIVSYNGQETGGKRKRAVQRPTESTTAPPPPACDECHRQKRGCDSGSPCVNCLRANRECVRSRMFVMRVLKLMLSTFKCVFDEVFYGIAKSQEFDGVREYFLPDFADDMVVMQGMQGVSNDVVIAVASAPNVERTIITNDTDFLDMPQNRRGTIILWRGIWKENGSVISFYRMRRNLWLHAFLCLFQNYANHLETLYHQGSCQLAIFSGEVVDGKIVASWELRTPTDKDLAHIRRIKKPIFLGV